MTHDLFWDDIFRRYRGLLLFAELFLVHISILERSTCVQIHPELHNMR